MRRPIRYVLAAVVAAAALGATAAPAAACTGTLCDTVNAACVVVRGEACVK